MDNHVDIDTDINGYRYTEKVVDTDASGYGL